MRLPSGKIVDHGLKNAYWKQVVDLVEKSTGKMYAKCMIHESILWSMLNGHKLWLNFKVDLKQESKNILENSFWKTAVYSTCLRVPKTLEGK